MSATVETLEGPERPPTTMGARLEGELLEVSMGPQHPSTHGVFRMNVALEGEIVRKLKPVFGYLHRNHEKLGENMSYLGSMPYTDRLDYFCSMTNNWAYALSVEKLAGIEIPDSARRTWRYLRSPDDPRPGDAGELVDPETTVPTNSARANHESEGENPR